MDFNFNPAEDEKDALTKYGRNLNQEVKDNKTVDIASQKYATWLGFSKALKQGQNDLMSKYHNN